MSRSFRKSPKCGMANAASEKHDKRIANRKFRHKNKQALEEGKEGPIKKQETSNVWTFNKDGKQYYGWMEYDEEYSEMFTKLMRK